MFVLFNIVAVMALAFLVSGCAVTPRYAFSQDNAAVHIRPYKVLEGYIKSYLSEKNSPPIVTRDTTLISESFPNAEMFNKDAILALLSAPGAEGIRIYLGKKTGDKKTTNGEIVFVLLPVDMKGNDIKARLLIKDTRLNFQSSSISSFEATKEDDAGKAEGVEDGQRCPQICNKE